MAHTQSLTYKSRDCSFIGLSPPSSIWPGSTYQRLRSQLEVLHVVALGIFSLRYKIYEDEATRPGNWLPQISSYQFSDKQPYWSNVNRVLRTSVSWWFEPWSLSSCFVKHDTLSESICLNSDVHVYQWCHAQFLKIDYITRDPHMTQTRITAMLEYWYVECMPLVSQ